MSRWLMGFLGLAFTFLIAAILFGSAGRWDLPWFGIYLGLWLLFTLITAAAVDLDLMKERLRPRAAGRDSLPLLRLLAAASLGGHFVVAGLDVGRYHWSDTVPLGVQVLGLIGFAAALALIRWTQHVNRFFSSAMRIQRDRGQHVITGGPYQYVRHPGYAAFILVALCSGVALGSWWSLLPPPPLHRPLHPSHGGGRPASARGAGGLLGLCREGTLPSRARTLVTTAQRRRKGCAAVPQAIR